MRICVVIFYAHHFLYFAMRLFGGEIFCVLKFYEKVLLVTLRNGLLYISGGEGLWQNTEQFQMDI